MFKNLFGRNKIKVELIEALSNEELGAVKLSPDQLPASFDKPTTMRIADVDWIVEKADPINAEEFIKKGELSLWVSKVLKMDPRNIRFSIPTISNELPATSSTFPFNDFTHTIDEDDWRQMEFLPFVQLLLIREEMKIVEEILFPENDPDFDSLNGFDRVHVRKKIERNLLSISVEDFLQIVAVNHKGNLAINGQIGFVDGGFSFRSANHVYYGTIKDSFIHELCLYDFDSIDEETSKVLEKFNLLLVCWCRGSITSF